MTGDHTNITSALAFDYRTEDFEARARQITGGRGVELILDAIGGDSLKKG